MFAPTKSQMLAISFIKLILVDLKRYPKFPFFDWYFAYEDCLSDLVFKLFCDSSPCDSKCCFSIQVQDSFFCVSCIMINLYKRGTGKCGMKDILPIDVKNKGAQEVDGHVLSRLSGPPRTGHGPC